MKKIRNIIIVLLVCVAIVFTISSILVDYKSHLVRLTDVEMPYVHNGDGKPLTKVRIGQEYYVRIDTSRIQPCDIVVTYYFEQDSMEDDKPKRSLWYPYPVYFARAAKGASKTDRFIVIPIYMKPGEYSLVRQATYTCGGETINKDFSIQITIAK